MKDTIIGVFDSGVGGLTVVRELRHMLPHRRLVYFGDTARTPYGAKSAETLIRYAIEDAKFLIDQGAGLIVIACHSAASVATDVLRKKLNVPVLEVITPSIDQAVARTRKKVIGLIGTRATVSSMVYEREIGARDPDIKVYSQACPLLVPLVEEGWFDTRETRMIVKKYLRALKDRQIDVLVLGCTHYPLLKPIILEKMGKNVEIIDPSQEVAKAVKDYLGDSDAAMMHQGVRAEARFFLSDLTPVTERIVRWFLKEDVRLEKADIS
ncbi:MAG: glutamate racemase [Dissulfurimicrobium sp.]|uniref:glutamate racemase n=1 Tax=Dissulfurimicrobium sp. TaxID=2022436 RepID=UPI004049C363